MLHRSYKKEFIDLGPKYYTSSEYKDCLRHLGRIGRILGGQRASLLDFKKLCPKPSSILDVGCGGGDMALKLAESFSSCRVVGVDTSSEAIAYAQNKKRDNLSFVHTEHHELQDADNSYDIVTATLVCHHMSDEEVILFLKKAVKVSRKCVIINDLHRCWFAYASFALVVPLLFRNRLIWHDGLLSVQRGFKRRDWIKILAQAGIKNYHLKWRWAFRWVLTIDSM